MTTIPVMVGNITEENSPRLTTPIRYALESARETINFVQAIGQLVRTKFMLHVSRNSTEEC